MSSHSVQTIWSANYGKIVKSTGGVATSTASQIAVRIVRVWRRVEDQSILLLNGIRVRPVVRQANQVFNMQTTHCEFELILKLSLYGSEKDWMHSPIRIDY